MSEQTVQANTGASETAVNSSRMSVRCNEDLSERNLRLDEQGTARSLDSVMLFAGMHGVATSKIIAFELPQSSVFHSSHGDSLRLVLLGGPSPYMENIAPGVSNGLLN